MPARTTASRSAAAADVDVAVDVNATPRAILDALFDGASLGCWAGTVRSVTVPRLLGPYVLERLPSDPRDDIFGRQGGVLRGTVMQFEATSGFFVADLFWLPPDANPIGPTALDVSCTLCLTPSGRPTTRIRVVQSGFADGARWRRYGELAREEWTRTLESLKQFLESQP